MADEYISKQDAKDVLQEKVFHNLTDEFYGAMQVIDELPPADVVPVVRCRDCKHWKSYYGRCYKHDEYGMASDDFCSYGERREKGGMM